MVPGEGGGVCVVPKTRSAPSAPTRPTPAMTGTAFLRKFRLETSVTSDSTLSRCFVLSFLLRRPVWLLLVLWQAQALSSDPRLAPQQPLSLQRFLFQQAPSIPSHLHSRSNAILLTFEEGTWLSSYLNRSLLVTTD